MAVKKTVAVATGTRADYGLLTPLVRLLHKDDEFDFFLLVTGTHLSPEFGHTVDQIYEDGFDRIERIECLLSSDDDAGVTKSAGLVLIGCAELFSRNRPDIVVLLGDRYEIHSVAASAAYFRIPVAHIHGGELTEGAMDNTIRHSVTKLSHLHFTATEAYRNRVLQLGEAPQTVFNVGAIGLDNIRSIEYLNRNELEEQLGIRFRARNILVTIHPETLASSGLLDSIETVLDSLLALDEVLIICTKANADQNGRKINAVLSNYARNNDSFVLFDSLGQRRYLSLMKEIDAVVGNSSSGIIEAPSFKVGTINIGTRQNGRVRAASVIDCLPDPDDLHHAFERLYSNEFQETLASTVNPYGDGHAAEQIVRTLKDVDLESLPQKRFIDIPLGDAL